MRCPTCQHKKTRIIRTRPDPDYPSTDLVRQCKDPGCLTVFTTREALISVIENSQDQQIVGALARRISALPNSARDALMAMVQMG